MFTKLHSAPKAPLFFFCYRTVVGDLQQLEGGQKNTESY